MYEPYGKVTVMDDRWTPRNPPTASDVDNDVLYCGYRQG